MNGARPVGASPPAGMDRPGRFDRPRRAGTRDARRGGFVLAMVVFLLFAIAVAGSMGYMVVNSEFAPGRVQSRWAGGPRGRTGGS